jgi:hypothetical protein
MMMPSYLLTFNAKMDLWVQPGNRAAVFSVEEPIVSAPEEDQTCLFQYKMHADYFFLHSCNCALQLHSLGSNYEPVFLFRCSVVCMGKCAAKTMQEVVHWRLVSPL